VEVPAAADTDASVSPNWGEQVGQEEASGGLAPDADVPTWARPTLSYAHVLGMARPRWLQGESASGHVARTLVTQYNSNDNDNDNDNFIKNATNVRKLKQCHTKMKRYKIPNKKYND